MHPVVKKSRAERTKLKNCTMFSFVQVKKFLLRGNKNNELLIINLVTVPGRRNSKTRLHKAVYVVGKTKTLLTLKRIILFLLIFFSSLLSIGQKIPNGVYIGYEQNPFCYSEACLIVHDTLMKEVKAKLYFKVSLSVTDTLVTLEKIPIYFFDNRDSTPVCDSTMGGYFFYKASFAKNKRPNPIYGDLILGTLAKCTYCKPCGGVCRYNNVSYQYRKYGQNFLFSSDKEFNILFEKQQ
jgi:hypothetical protein